jgi:integrase
MVALSPEQARHVLALAEDDPLEALWRLAITCGLRQGELLALRWSDVDLDRGTLSVVATLEQWRDGVPVIAEPKTARSRRQVELGEAAVEALRRHRQRNPGIGFVFTRPDGRPLSRPMVGGAWRSHRLRAVPAVRFHDLRHTAATLMLSRGVHPKIVSEMLGHSTVAITLDLYSHVTPTMQREAASVMNDLLSQ